MLAILSPAKNMRQPGRTVPLTTDPQFLEQAAALHETLAQYSPYALESLMKISAPLALKACADLAQWQDTGGAPALLSYDGLAYKNLAADTFTEEDLLYAQTHLRILSALYGVLRPLDLIRPYRLEMNHKPGGASLYAHWGDQLYRSLFSSGDAVINLSSGEYTKAIAPHLTRADVFLTCDFLTYRRGKLTCLATVAKMARGQMARFLVQNRIDTPQGLFDFCWQDFQFDPALSNDRTLTFVQR